MHADGFQALKELEFPSAIALSEHSGQIIAHASLDGKFAIAYMENLRETWVFAVSRKILKFASSRLYPLCVSLHSRTFFTPSTAA